MEPIHADSYLKCLGSALGFDVGELWRIDLAEGSNLKAEYLQVFIASSDEEIRSQLLLPSISSLKDHNVSPLICEGICYNGCQLIWANSLDKKYLIESQSYSLKTAIGIPLGILTDHLYVIILFSFKKILISSDGINFIANLTKSLSHDSSSLCFLPPSFEDDFHLPIVNQWNYKMMNSFNKIFGHFIDDIALCTLPVCQYLNSLINADFDSSSYQIFHSNRSDPCIQSQLIQTHPSVLLPTLRVDGTCVTSMVSDEKVQSKNHFKSLPNLSNEHTHIKMDDKNSLVNLFPDHSHDSLGLNIDDNDTNSNDTVVSSVCQKFDNDNDDECKDLSALHDSNQILNFEQLYGNDHINERFQQFLSAFVTMTIFDAGELWMIESAHRNHTIPLQSGDSRRCNDYVSSNLYLLASYHIEGIMQAWINKSRKIRMDMNSTDDAVNSTFNTKLCQWCNNYDTGDGIFGNHIRLDLARKVGIRTVFTSPISNKWNGDVIGIIAFYSRTKIDRSNMAIELLKLASFLILPLKYEKIRVSVKDINETVTTICQSDENYADDNIVNIPPLLSIHLQMIPYEPRKILEDWLHESALPSDPIMNLKRKNDHIIIVSDIIHSQAIQVMKKAKSVTISPSSSSASLSSFENLRSENSDHYKSSHLKRSKTLRKRSKQSKLLEEFQNFILSRQTNNSSSNALFISNTNPNQRHHRSNSSSYIMTDQNKIPYTILVDSHFSIYVPHSNSFMFMKYRHFEAHQHRNPALPWINNNNGSIYYSAKHNDNYHNRDSSHRNLHRKRSHSFSEVYNTYPNGNMNPNKLSRINRTKKYHTNNTSRLDTTDLTLELSAHNLLYLHNYHRLHHDTEHEHDEIKFRNQASLINCNIEVMSTISNIETSSYGSVMETQSNLSNHDSSLCETQSNISALDSHSNFSLFENISLIETSSLKSGGPDHDYLDDTLTHYQRINNSNRLIQESKEILYDSRIKSPLNSDVEEVHFADDISVAHSLVIWSPSLSPSLSPYPLPTLSPLLSSTSVDRDICSVNSQSNSNSSHDSNMKHQDCYKKKDDVDDFKGIEPPYLMLCHRETDTNTTAPTCPFSGHNEVNVSSLQTMQMSDQSSIDPTHSNVLQRIDQASKSKSHNYSGDSGYGSSTHFNGSIALKRDDSIPHTSYAYPKDTEDGLRVLSLIGAMASDMSMIPPFHSSREVYGNANVDSTPDTRILAGHYNIEHSFNNFQSSFCYPIATSGMNQGNSTRPSVVNSNYSSAPITATYHQQNHDANNFMPNSNTINSISSQTQSRINNSCVNSNLAQGNISTNRSRMCQFKDCSKYAQSKTNFCIAHGGGRRCHHEGCTKAARDRFFCTAHGGGRRCTKDGCTKAAVGPLDLCLAHGGGKRCAAEGCAKAAQSGTLHCVRHGGGKQCAHEGCVKVTHPNAL